MTTHGTIWRSTLYLFSFFHIPYEEKRWTLFESYKSKSSGVVDDYHWNENGNLQFALWVQKQFNLVGSLNKNYYI